MTAADDIRTPPVAKKVESVSTMHGDRRVDPYAWLRDKGNPEVIKYLEAENAYADAVMAPLEALEGRLYDEMLGRIKQTDVSVPYRKGRFLYYSRTEEGKQYPVFCRKKAGVPTPEDVLLDGNALAAGKSFWSMDSFAVSDDGNWLAYSTDTTGYRQYVLEAEGPAHGAGAAHTARARHVGRVGRGQPHPLLHHGRRDHQAIRPLLPCDPRRPGRGDAGLRREGRALQRGGAARTRSERLPLPRDRQPDVLRGAGPAGSHADRPMDDGRTAACRHRVQRRPPRRASSTSG